WAYHGRRLSEIGERATLTATLMIEPEQPCRIVDQQQPAMLVVWGIQDDEIHQVAVVRHIRNVRVWPVSSPQHASRSGLDECPSEWNGVVKRRGGGRNTLWRCGLPPATFVRCDA